MQRGKCSGEVINIGPQRVEAAHRQLKIINKVVNISAILTSLLTDELYMTPEITDQSIFDFIFFGRTFKLQCSIFPSRASHLSLQVFLAKNPNIPSFLPKGGKVTIAGVHGFPDVLLVAYLVLPSGHLPHQQWLVHWLLLGVDALIVGTWLCLLESTRVQSRVHQVVSTPDNATFVTQPMSPTPIILTLLQMVNCHQGLRSNKKNLNVIKYASKIFLAFHPATFCSL